MLDILYSDLVDIRAKCSKKRLEYLDTKVEEDNQLRLIHNFVAKKLDIQVPPFVVYKTKVSGSEVWEAGWNITQLGLTQKTLSINFDSYFNLVGVTEHKHIELLRRLKKKLDKPKEEE